MALSVKNPFTLGNTLEGLLGGGAGLGDELFGGPINDPTLRTALPAEASLRNRLNFANIRISFPTTAGSTALTNLFSSTALSFPAYITSLNQNFNPSFSATPVYGRNDPIPTYRGTSRTIRVTLKIPCFDEVDANENMKKVNQFIKNIYPSYNEFKGDLIIASPPLVRVKFANLIVDPKFSFRGLLGYINNFTYSFNPADGFFMDRSEGGTSNLFFREYTIGFTMNVLHEKVIGTINGRPNNPTDYPYRTRHNIFSPIQQRSSEDLSKTFGLSGDLSEAKILR
tara:strand:- start:4629 stop:5477 length:849 start_codon:yes stop_codon:yes gene_type:complete